MSTTTLCPACNTRFKVTQEQLDAHQGLVRCGRCQTIFNATEYLQDDQPNPQLDLPIALETTASGETSVGVPIEIPPAPIPAPFTGIDLSLPEADSLEPQAMAQLHIENYDVRKPQAEQPVNFAPPQTMTLAQQIILDESPRFTDLEPIEKNHSWSWLVGSLLLLVLLLAQAAYFFRVELAASQPALKPTLLSYCLLLRCSVPLPQKADLMSIESSELEADPAQASVITLNALLRNHASYAQAFPNLELTLTDAQDKPLARRTFRPTEYLKPGENEKQGLAANREISVKLNLDTTDLKASGYRLLLFYSQ